MIANHICGLFSGRKKPMIAIARKMIPPNNASYKYANRSFEYPVVFSFLKAAELVNPRTIAFAVPKKPTNTAATVPEAPINASGLAGKGCPSPNHQTARTSTAPTYGQDRSQISDVIEVASPHLAMNVEHELTRPTYQHANSACFFLTLDFRLWIIAHSLGQCGQWGHPV